PHRGALHRAAFSPDGSAVVTASDDGTARLWNAATCRPIGQPLRHASFVWWAEFSRDGRRVATACADGTARTSHVPTGQRAAPPAAAAPGRAGARRRLEPRRPPLCPGQRRGRGPGLAPAVRLGA